MAMVGQYELKKKEVIDKKKSQGTAETPKMMPRCVCFLEKRTDEKKNFFGSIFDQSCAIMIKKGKRRKQPTKHTDDTKKDLFYGCQEVLVTTRC